MVLLKEISEGIWGLALGPNKTSEIVTDHPFRLTMAALDIDVEDSESTPNGITCVTIKSNTADKGPPIDLILCNLQYPSCLQQPLDIEIYDGQTLTFGVKGPHKVHLTGYVLQPEPQEMCEEDQLRVGKTGDYFQAAGESDSNDDDDDDDDDSDDDEDDFHLARRHRLRDDEDQDLEGDYEDGYLEGEDELSSETSSSDSDNDEQPKNTVSSTKNKKRQRTEANGHSTKQEPKTKKVKKIETEETTNESKKTKKSAKKTTAAAAEASTTDSNATTSTTTDDKKKSNSLEINDLRVGNGLEAKLGKTVAVYYTGRLKSNNTTFDSCVKGKPFRFRLGAGEVIRGWDQGVKGMRVGGKRRLTIPPSLAYGSQRLPDIPPNSTLVFDVELRNVF